VDGAADLHPRYERPPGEVAGHAAPGQDIDEVQSRVLDPDGHLARPGGRLVSLAFFLEHLSRPVFEAGLWQAVQGKWDGIREAFHGFDPAQVAAMTPAEIAATENDPRVIRNKAKIRATVQNAREVLAVLDSYGSIRAYLASFPDAHAASADMRRRFKFLGDAGVWRLLTSAVRDIGG
jgi:3-methyladenine DNA glycosylase Tag